MLYGDNKLIYIGLPFDLDVDFIIQVPIRE